MKKKLKIAFHTNQLCVRGTSVAIYDYAHYNEELLGNESIVLYDKNNRLNREKGIERFKSRFEIFGYGDFSEVDYILEKEKADAAYFMKSGFRDGKQNNYGKCLVHAVFNYNDRHGDKYAYVSDWLSKKASGGKYPFVPYMVHLPFTDGDMRDELSIPKDAVVFGRHGGSDQFDIDFVWKVVEDISKNNENIYFLFLNTKPFCEKHKNIIHLPAITDLEKKSKFIKSCDAMIHARERGETFGCSIAEFLFLDRPVIASPRGKDGAHKAMLGEAGIWYDNENDLKNILVNFTPMNNSGKYAKLVEEYAPENVMRKFEEVFLNEI